LCRYLCCDGIDSVRLNYQGICINTTVGAIYRGLGNLQQMPHRQNLRPPWASQQLAAIERRCRSAVEQAGGVEQGIFKTQIVVDVVETLAGQVMVDGAFERGTVFCRIEGGSGTTLFMV